MLVECWRTDASHIGRGSNRTDTLDMGQHLPLRLNDGRIEDQSDPQLRTEELVEMYRLFLQNQFQVVSRRFGRENARRALARMLRQLAPELQDIARRYGFDKPRAT